MNFKTFHIKTLKNLLVLLLAGFFVFGNVSNNSTNDYSTLTSVKTYNSVSNSKNSFFTQKSQHTNKVKFSEQDSETEIEIDDEFSVSYFENTKNPLFLSVEKKAIYLPTPVGQKTKLPLYLLFCNLKIPAC